MITQNNRAIANFLLFQVISYGIVSLVSDVGGTLGLFVGFSFFSLWDICKDLAVVLGHAFKSEA